MSRTPINREIPRGEADGSPTEDAMTRNVRGYSDRFPPKNRPRTAWPHGLVDIEVISADGRAMLNPSSLIIASHDGELDGLTPLSGVGSDISGEPAVRVNFDSVELALTTDELRRLATGTLDVGQFFALADRFGVFYEISSKFYDEDTGDSRALRQARLEEMAMLMADKNLLLSSAADGRVKVAFDDGPVVHEGIAADEKELRVLLKNLGYSVES